MLSRTASQLFWMSRYLERAENLVRMLDVTHSLSLLPQSRGAMTELAAPLAVTGTLESFTQSQSSLDPEHLFNFMALDLANPASVLSCLKGARENAHAVRGQITAEMWEAINSTWLEARSFPKRGIPSVSSFFDWVKERSHLFRGATYGTLQRNDAYNFIRLGTFIERADNTARLLDVKSQLIEPAVESLVPVDVPVESAPDFYAWSALLRSLSAFEAYHAVYRESLDGRRVTELLILRPDIPRSLRACCDEIVAILPHIEAKPGAQDAGREVKRLAGQLALRLEYGAVDEILDAGVHRWLTQFLEESAQLANAIREAYLEAN
ncbi:alpha-E domain-containing protein [Paucibacter sp. XJ19-41]|uniref:alpha-E domain-containing protein n=1 Tax=Paucibacter sp. XJ19-41 TaxID=2927824 RepID=UPI00234ADB9F|nr:alpha-E domain-containing protein [Paucibacter sp. XJ19-41]MDC6168073.1 alpha-E domain-containing protein [Paucibacter sp. XJ19-41]